MSEFDEHAQRTLHENLQRLGPHLALPPSPTALTRARWKHRPRRLRYLRRHKLFAALSGGGALAAAVALSVLVFSTRTAPVSAGMVYQELREALGQGALITLNNVIIDLDDLDLRRSEAQESVSGRVVVGGRIYVDGNAGRVYFELQIRAQHIVAPEAPGEPFTGEVELVTSFSQEQEWGYACISELPPSWIPEAPWATAVYRAARSGVYYKLDGLFAQRLGIAENRDALIARLGRLLAAMRDPKRLDRFIERLEQATEDVVVTELPDQQLILRATGFRAPEDVFSQALWQDTEYTIHCSRHEGLKQMHIRDLGAGSGTATIDLTEKDFDVGLLALDSHMRSRPAPVLDIGKMADLWRMIARLGLTG